MHIFIHQNMYLLPILASTKQSYINDKINFFIFTWLQQAFVRNSVKAGLVSQAP